MHQHSQYRSPRREETKKGPENIFEDRIVENFPNMGKETVTYIQAVQRVPHRTNPRRNMLRLIDIKLTKIEDKEKILKATGKSNK